MPCPTVVYLDVTDTLSSPWTAGIQRVVRGLAAALAAHPDLRLVPLVRIDGSQRFRTLVGDEAARLARAPAGSLAAPRAPRVRPWLDALDDGLPPSVMRVARALVRPVRAAQYRLRDERLRLLAERRYREVTIRRYESGAVLLEADAVWNQVGVDRERWYRRLRADGVRVVPFVHDLLPIEHPDWFVPSLVSVFTATLRTQVAAADLVLTNSESTADAVRRLAASLGRRDLRVVDVPLGADEPTAVTDVSSSTGPPGRSGAGGSTAAGARRVLVVGTIEPRKNHRVLLEAWDRLGAQGRPDGAELVVVGRPGWRADDVVAALRARSTDGVRWLSDADDDRLAECFREADLVAVPSLTEGYGLPVVEALRAGVPVVSSRGGALAAFGARAPGAVELVDPGDVGAWADALRRHLSDPAHHARAREAVRGVEVPSWSDTADLIAAALAALGGVAHTGGADPGPPS